MGDVHDRETESVSKIEAVNQVKNIGCIDKEQDLQRFVWSWIAWKKFAQCKEMYIWADTP